MLPAINIFWFRRDLRLEDNTGLTAALSSGLPVLPLFIFDRHILDELEDKNDQRLLFIHRTVISLHTELQASGGLLAPYGFPEQVFEELLGTYSIRKVFTNHDYEPYATRRDNTIRDILSKKNVELVTFKDQVIFEKSEVMKKDGTPYSVFTPYANAWKSKYGETPPQMSSPDLSKFFSFTPPPIPSLSSMGFDDKLTQEVPPLDDTVFAAYHSTRNTPSVEGTSRAGVHLRFGTVSVRKLVADANKTNPIFLSELIWREFFMQQLWHKPDLVSHACKKEYDSIPWRNNEKEFHKWCEGQTGYPLVDAGMRQLNTTGFMHNRVRMVAASFLVKHLLVDWRWGEDYFGRKLLDYELSSNNGNWQWVAGCGCDAAPYFRIFNPSAQTKRFDPKYRYIAKWVPEWNTPSYPPPMVNHETARERCLKTYKSALLGARSK